MDTTEDNLYDFLSIWRKQKYAKINKKRKQNNKVCQTAYTLGMHPHLIYVNRKKWQGTAPPPPTQILSTMHMVRKVWPGKEAMK